MPGSTRRLRTALLTPALLAAAALGGPIASASAGADAFCGYTVGTGGCYGPAHSLTSVRATSDGSGMACGGSNSTSLWYCGNATGCRIYSGGTVRTPVVRPYSGSRYIAGYSTWGSTGPAGGCPSGGGYNLALAGDDALPTGVPALDNGDPVPAPDVVADAVPGLDASQAHPFSTPSGDGWVLPDARNGAACIVVESPDGDGYGASCTPLREARAHGMVAVFADGNDASATGDLAMVVMPAGAEQLTVRRAGASDRVVEAVDGVAVVAMSSRDRTLVVTTGDGVALRQRVAR